MALTQAVMLNERDAIRAWMPGASLEMSPRERDAIAAVADFLPSDTEVFVSAPPSVNHHEIVSAAVALRKRGFEPVPHVAARSLVGFTQLNDLLARVAGEAGVRRALVVGGDLEPPAGPFHDSFNILSLGLFEKYGFARIGLAGYPEGHPRIAQPALERALAAKLALLRQAGIEAHVVTQFGFDAAPVLTWLQTLQVSEPSLPVRIGLAGPAGIATLARYAVRCGIGHSIGALVRHGTSIARLVTEAGPEIMLRQLATAKAEANHVHFFSFGGFLRTARWLRAVADGDFRVDEEGPGFTVAD